MLENIADIQLPDPPDWSPIISLVTITLLILVFLVIIYFSKRRIKPTYNPINKTFLTRLEEIEQAWKTDAQLQRDCAYELAGLLQQALATNELKLIVPPALSNTVAEQHWATLVKWLNTYRYAPVNNEPVNQAIFNSSRIILATLTKSQADVLI